jgi:predicted permease
MVDVLNLALPYFGLIFIGFACGKAKGLPEQPWEVPAIIAVKILIHPLVVFGLMLLLGPFAQPWAATAVLMASLPPALNVFVIARQNDSSIEPASVRC